MARKPRCPVCKLNVEGPLPEFCERCGWELKADISLMPSIELPEEVLAAYERKLSMARRKWAEYQKEREKRGALEKRLGKLEAQQSKLMAALEKSEAEKKSLRQERRVESPPATGTVEPPRAAKGSYTEKTPVPELSRDPFETPEEFVARIDGHPPVPAGKGTLIKQRYDIATGRFPMEITWAEWIRNAGNIGRILPREGHVTADRLAARSIFEAGPSHPIYARLKVIEGSVRVAKLELSNGEWMLPVTTNSKKKKDGKEWTDPVTGMEFIFVPGGVFEMGDTFGDDFDDEQPVHKVELDSFYIGKYPVTQGQWIRVMGNNPSRFSNGENYPVEEVSWKDAKSFIDKLNKMGKAGWKFTLPTEAQWEYAARSGGRKERYAGSDNIDEVAWYSSNSGKSTRPVGEKKPNGLGIYDMSGNVWEWCEDIYADNAYKRHGKKNPIYTRGGSNRVLRGGSWYFDAGDARCAYRNRNDPAGRAGDIGFRLARTI